MVLRLVDLMNLILILSRPNDFQETKSDTRFHTKINIGFHLDICNRISSKLCVMIDITKLY